MTLLDHGFEISSKPFYYCNVCGEELRSIRDRVLVCKKHGPRVHPRVKFPSVSTGKPVPDVP